MQSCCSSAGGRRQTGLKERMAERSLEKPRTSPENYVIQTSGKTMVFFFSSHVA